MVGHLIAWILVGLIAGAVAGKVVAGGGFGPSDGAPGAGRERRRRSAADRRGGAPVAARCPSDPAFARASCAVGFLHHAVVAINHDAGSYTNGSWLSPSVIAWVRFCAE
jgi:hypothetical protein